MQRIYLTRRNLLTLLSKLDRKKAGDETQCTIVKRDTFHPKYPATDTAAIVAVEDEDYYTDRPAGEMNSLDEPKPEVSPRHPHGCPCFTCSHNR